MSEVSEHVIHSYEPVKESAEFENTIHILYDGIQMHINVCEMY